MTSLFIRWLRQCLAVSEPSPRAPQAVRSWHPTPAQTSADAALPVHPAPRPEWVKRPPAIAQRTPATRIIEWETAANGSVRTLGRVVMVGKFSEICAELDRLAALEMA